MADVFVSYKREDRERAARIVELLRADGRSVWWDEGLTPERAWDATIEEEIARACAVLVLWSPRSVGSEWVRSEAQYAQQHGKLIPTVIEPCNLPLAFALRQSVDLSADKLDGASEAWRKLSGWVSDLVEKTNEPASSSVAAAPPRRVPSTRVSLRRWAPWLAGGLALLAIAAVTGAFLLHNPRPDVVVDRFAVDAGSGLPRSFASDLNDEMFAAFSSSSRIAPRLGNGRRVHNAYQLTGRIEADADKLRVFAQVFAPGNDAPIVTTKIEQPRSEDSGAPTELGLTLAKTVRCIATASDTNNSATKALPREALKSWARFCVDQQKSDTTAAMRLSTLRTVVAEAPDFATGWANLAEAMAGTAPQGEDRVAWTRDYVAAADKALALDPTTAKAYIVKAWARLPYCCSSTYDDFEGWQQLVDKAMKARPSDCGCEGIQYGFMLLKLGRASAAIPLFERGAAGQHLEWEAALFRGYALAVVGRSDEAKTILEDLGNRWPGEPAIRHRRLQAAIWRRDWPSAESLARGLPETPTKSALLKFIIASANHDQALLKEAGDDFEKLVATNDGLNPTALMGLAMTASPDIVVEAEQRFMRKVNEATTPSLFDPPFAEARRTPAFAAMMQRTGIFRYWRQPSHLPDFCNEANAPDLCRQLRSGR